MASEDFGLFVMFAAFISAMIVSTIVAVRSSARGDTIWQEWWKRGLAGFATMMGVTALLFLVGKLVFHIR